MASDGLLEKADWSCLNSPKDLGLDIDVFASHYQIQLDKEKIKELYTKLPHVLYSEKDLDHRTISAWTDKNADAHRNSYFYVCTETYVHGEYKMLTEKVFKPIANFQPFVFLAYPVSAPSTCCGSRLARFFEFECRYICQFLSIATAN
jgi:hypothetical protein